MANVILVDEFPGGKSIESGVQVFRGSIALAGSAVSTGEPLNWSNLVTGVGYNEVNRIGGGAHGTGQAYVTAFSASAVSKLQKHESEMLENSQQDKKESVDQKSNPEGLEAEAEMSEDLKSKVQDLSAKMLAFQIQKCIYLILNDFIYLLGLL
jgi:hypothetical protein